MAEPARAVRVGHITVIAHADAVSLLTLADRFRSHGYEVQRTRHFAMCRNRPRNGRTYLMHTFTEASVDEDVGTFIGEELAPLGFPNSPKEFGDALFGIVASTCPPSLICPKCGRLHLDHPQMWRHFSLNSLNRLRRLLRGPPSDAGSESHIVQFAAIYRRIIECRSGTSLLDVGTNLGLLPVLLADDNTILAGCDNRQDAVVNASDLAEAAGANVSFMLADVLSADFPQLGTYDTVTAVHVLEHLDERDVEVALASLLSVTRRRLIISVPYETEPQRFYGHVQLLTPVTMEHWGRWCVEHLRGGAYSLEDVSGGFLVIDRTNTADLRATDGLAADQR